MGRIGPGFYKRILEKFLALLKEEFQEDLVSLVLYGSIARGKGDALSDIDLLLISEDPHQNYHRRLDEVLDVEDRLRKSKEYREMKERVGQEPYFSFLLFSRKEAEENRYVFLDMVDDAKILYDKNNFFENRLNQIRVRLQELGARKIVLEDGSWFWDLKPDLKVGDVFTL